MSSDPSPPSSLGRYRIERRLGSGAMGDVFLALDPQIERHLAIKTVRLHGSSSEVGARKRRLLMEAKAAGRLVHPNVVTLFDAGEDQGVVFLAFEYVEGVDLAERIGMEPPLTLKEALTIVTEMADALAHAHSHGIVHRDIKPSNVLLTRAGVAKIGDFGIAKLHNQATELTATGMLVGTPHYMSPEQVRGETLDGRSDLFSLGSVLFELLHRARPFPAETLTTLVYQILHQDPMSRNTRAGLPEPLEGVLKKMLAKSPDERYASAEAFATELRSIQASLSAEILGVPAHLAGEQGAVAASSAALEQAATLGSDGRTVVGGATSGEPNDDLLPPRPATPPPPPPADTAPVGAVVDTAPIGAAADTAPIGATADTAPVQAQPSVPEADPAPPPAAATDSSAGSGNKVLRWVLAGVAVFGFLGALGVLGLIWLWWMGSSRTPEDETTDSTEQVAAVDEDQPVRSETGLEDATEPPADLQAVSGRSDDRSDAPPSDATGSDGLADRSSTPVDTDRRERATDAAAGRRGTTPSSQPARDSERRSEVAAPPPERGDPPPADRQSSADRTATPVTTETVQQTQPEVSVPDSGLTDPGLTDPGPTLTAEEPPDEQPPASPEDLFANVVLASDIESGLDLSFQIEPKDSFVLFKAPGDTRFNQIGRAEEYDTRKRRRRPFTLPGPGDYLFMLRRDGSADYYFRVRASAGRSGPTVVRARLGQ